MEVSQLPIVSVPLHLPQLIGLVGSLEVLVVHQVAEVQPVGHMDELSSGPDVVRDGDNGGDDDDDHDDDDGNADDDDTDDHDDKDTRISVRSSVRPSFRS